jgi:hypothetical protein
VPEGLVEFEPALEGNMSISKKEFDTLGDLPTRPAPSGTEGGPLTGLMWWWRRRDHLPGYFATLYQYHGRMAMGLAAPLIRLVRRRDPQLTQP